MDASRPVTADHHGASGCGDAAAAQPGLQAAGADGMQAGVACCSEVCVVRPKAAIRPQARALFQHLAISPRASELGLRRLLAGASRPSEADRQHQAQPGPWGSTAAESSSDGAAISRERHFGKTRQAFGSGSPAGAPYASWRPRAAIGCRFSSGRPTVAGAMFLSAGGHARRPKMASSLLRKV